MEDFKKELARHDMIGRWKSLEEKWETVMGGNDALWIENGIEDDEVRKVKTIAF